MNVGTIYVMGILKKHIIDSGTQDEEIKIRVDKGLKDRLKEEAKKNGKTLSAYIKDILSAILGS